MVIIPEISDALSYYTITGSLALYKFLLYGQMNVKIINIKYLFLKNLKMLKVNALA